MTTLPLYNIEAKEIDKVELDETVFDGRINPAVIYQAVCAFRANQRKGLAATKTRGEVSGGGRKPWKQKGTGRARAGSTRSPLWRHGGVVFGPHPRDYSYQLPQKIRNTALKSSLNSKVKTNSLMVLDELKLDKPKTKEMAKILSNFKIEKTGRNNALLLLDAMDKNLKLSLRNISFVNTNLARQTNVYEVLNSRKIIITKQGLSELVKRLKQ